MTSPCLNAFLLTRDWHDIKHTDGTSCLTLTLWATSALGPVQLQIHEQRAVFFVEASDLHNVHQHLHSVLGPPHSEDYPRGVWHSNAIGLWSFRLQNVCAVYFQEQRLLYRARESLREHDITVFEADINPADRFLMERFITGSLQISGDLQAREGYLECVNPRIKAAPYVPAFKVVSLDIETSMTGDHLFSIGVVACLSHDSSPGIQRVFMIGKPSASAACPDYLTYCSNETSLLTNFLQFIHDYDPDILIGWNVINFDLRFLQRKADKLRLPLSLGRAHQPLDWRQHQNHPDHYTVKAPGRLILDGIDTLKSATFNFESFSLQYVSNTLLQRGKLIHEADHRGEEITRLFNEDKPALAAYNLEDCQLVRDIFVQAQLFDFAVARAQLTGLPMDRVGGSVAAFDYRYLPRLHRAGFVAPTLPDDAIITASPGGYVMDSFPGIYDHVLVLDFKSLYPSIIRTFRIDPLGLVEGMKGFHATPGHSATASGDPHLQETRVDDKGELVPGYNGAIFSKTHHILPDIIRELWEARDDAKRQKNAALSQAIKILMNSFYGVLGTPGCRFFDSRLPSSITLRGHDILARSKAFIEQRGHQVIYGDTDSVFVWLKDLPRHTSPADIRVTGATLARDLNAWWAISLQQQYQLTSYLEIQFETHFTRFIMPTIRGSDVGSKKRYAGLTYPAGLENPLPADARLVFKGLESVRTDWTPLAREFQRELYRRIFFNEPYDTFIRHTIADIRQGKRDAQLIYRKRLRRSLDEYQRNIPPHVQAAHRAEAHFTRQGLPSRYRRGGWIQYVMTTQGPEPLECISSPIDHEHYVARQIKPIVDGILNFYHTSFDAIVQPQLRLFDDDRGLVNPV